MRINPVWQGLILGCTIDVRCRQCGTTHSPCFVPWFWPGDPLPNAKVLRAPAFRCMLPKGHAGEHSNRCPSCGAEPYRPFEPNV
jgi:hypothetical protein